jgi:hypothetical protein
MAKRVLWFHYTSSQEHPSKFLRQLAKKRPRTRAKKIKMEEIIKRANDNRIKIKLDYKTAIIIGSIDAFKIWKDKYPEALLIE